MRLVEFDYLHGSHLTGNSFNFGGHLGMILLVVVLRTPRLIVVSNTRKSLCAHEAVIKACMKQGANLGYSKTPCNVVGIDVISKVSYIT